MNLMTDRELLELAAKAAGVEYEEWATDIFVIKGTDNCFDPLTDDGDALRLAVKLNFDVSVYIADETGPACTIVAGYENLAYFKEIHSNDPYAATRRAIVRAAAEIGRSVK